MKSFLPRKLPASSLRLLVLGVVLALGAALCAPLASAQNSVAQNPPAQDAAPQSRAAQNRVSTLPGPEAVAEHWTTGFPLTGAHERTRCESCHVRGEFKNTPKTCTGCHTASARISTVVITSSHVPTAQQCSVCHNTLSFANAQFDHAGVVPGTCATCHNGTTATGKPSGHLVTSASCDSCHSTFSWVTVRFDHAGVTPGSCATCHNGARATAQPGSHIPTSLACDACHSTQAWNQAPMNHAGIANGCSNCHASGQSFAGVTPASPPSTHIPFGTAACESCHSALAFASFAGTQMNHAPVAGIPCATCHETGRTFVGVTIITRPTPAQDPGHPVSGDCGSCHTSTSSFRSGVSTQPASHIPTSQPCTTCHATPGTYAGGTMNHVGIASGCAACHAGGLSFTGVVPVSPPPTHIPTSQPCELCHSPAKFTTFAGGTMTHAGIASGCASCHAVGKSFLGVSVVTPPATHVPVGTATCESCHAAAMFTSFGGTQMNHTPVAGVPCATCHESGKSFSGVTIVTRPTAAQDPNHPPTGECGSCHTSTVSFSAGVTAQPSNHIPTSQPCALCHLTPGNYSVATMNHAGISAGCATCHSTGLTFANVIPVAPPPSHLPISQPCEVCHSPGKFTNFAGTTMNHAGISSGCDSCHAIGKSYFGVTIVTPPATHIPFGGSACESCHAPAAFTNFGGTAMNHSAVGGIACATCHETGKSFYGVIIVTRPTPAQDKSHPQTGDCGSCHSSTTSFTAGDDHPAGQSHPDDAALHALPHDPRQLLRCHDESRGHHDRLRGLSRDRPQLRQRHTRLATADARADIAVLRALPLARQVHELQRRRNEPLRNHFRMHELSRQRQELLRRDDRDPAGHAHSNWYSRLRELPLARDVHELRRHEDEPRAGRRHSLRHLSRERQGLLRSNRSRAAGDAPAVRHVGLRQLPRPGRVHEFRRSGDEPLRGRRRDLRLLPRDRQELLRRHDRDPTDTRAGQESPADRRLRHLPRVDDVVHGRHHRDAGQPHPDNAALRAVPHDAWQLCDRYDESRGHQQRMLDLPRQRTDFRQRSPRVASANARSDGPALRALPLARQVQQFQRRHDEPQWHLLGMRELSLHRDDLLRSDDRHAPGHARSDRRLRLRELPRSREIHELRRHDDEPRAGLRRRVRDVPRGRQELLRRQHRHPAHAGAGPDSPADRRLRQLPQLHHFVHGRDYHPAGEPHPDDAALRAVPHDARQLCDRHDESRGHQRADARPATRAA